MYQFLRSRISLAWLRKPGSAQGFVPQMEGLRFIALSAVFLLHLDQAVRYRMHEENIGSMGHILHALCSVGDFGVQIFFAVSGFVLSLPFLRNYLENGKPVVLKQYLLRRLWRLEPPLIINLLLLTPLIFWVTGQFSVSEMVRRFMLTLSYSHYMVTEEMSPINRVTWSLETEAQFYLCMPLIALLFKLRQPTIRRALLISFSCICILVKPFLNKAALPAQFEYFAIGILLADLYITQWKGKQGNSSAWDVVSIISWPAILATLAFLDQNHGFWKHLCLSIFVFAAFSSVLRGRFSHRLMANRGITLIGGMCYSFYLYHDPVLRFGGAVLSRWMPQQYESRFLAEFLVLLPAVAIVTLVTYALFERPFMGLKSKQQPRLDSADTVAASLQP